MYDKPHRRCGELNNNNKEPLTYKRSAACKHGQGFAAGLGARGGFIGQRPGQYLLFEAHDEKKCWAWLQVLQADGARAGRV